MTETRDNSPELHPPPAKDNFKLIYGIGPVTENRLYNAGIHTFAQLAKLSPEAIADCVPSLSATQVQGQEWIPQARRLASGRIGSKPRRKQKDIPTPRQHYENFTFEFLLNEKNKIHRLRITHVQSGDVDTWRSWNPVEISGFLARHTGARLALPVPQRTARPKNGNTLQPSHPSTKLIADVEENASFPPADPESALPMVGENTSNTALVTPTHEEASGQIRLLEWKTRIPGSNQNLRDLPQNQIVEVCLTLEISDTDLPAIPYLDIAGRLFAKKVGGGSSQVMGEVQSRIPYSPIFNLTIDSHSLSPGLYRLEAAIETMPAGTTTSPYHFTALIAGGLIHVY